MSHFPRKRLERDLTLDYDFIQLANHYGYAAEEHYVHTQDGFILGVHRLGIADQSTGGPSTNSRSKGVVFIQHGFMQNSESWVVRGPGKSLAFTLVDEGYDVWFGNNRGNKYSYKHHTYSSQDEKFWDFCIDDFAMYDIPAMLKYVLKQTEAPNLSYIGFSQGTAQAFACFSTNQEIASKINLFVALAPATRVNQLKNPLVAAVASSKPSIVFLLFGKKALLGQTLFWRRVLSTQAFTYIIDLCLDFLFGWNMANLEATEKPVLYSHLYSYSSVKTLVHWFQITSNQHFQAFDDNIKNRNPASSYKSYVLPSYLPSRIKCPMAVFYGGRDTVPQMDWLLSQLPEGTFVHREESYEHLDFVWAKTAPSLIDKQVVQLINQRSTPSKMLRKSLSEGLSVEQPTVSV